MSAALTNGDNTWRGINAGALLETFSILRGDRRHGPSGLDTA